MTDEHKNAILKKHNDLRQKAASGNEERGDPGPQPAAKDMPNLVCLKFGGSYNKV